MYMSVYIYIYIYIICIYIDIYIYISIYVGQRGGGVRQVAAAGAEADQARPGGACAPRAREGRHPAAARHERQGGDMCICLYVDLYVCR